MVHIIVWLQATHISDHGMRPFVGLIDGSLRGTGGVLCQEYDGKLCAVGYCSHKLTSAETNYPITEIEGLAVLHLDPPYVALSI